MIQFESVTCDDFRDNEDGGVSVAWKIRLKNETGKTIKKARFNSVTLTSDGKVVGSSFPSEVEVNIESGGHDSIEDTIDIDRRYLNPGCGSLKLTVFSRLYSAEEHVFDSIPTPSDSETALFLEKQTNSQLIRDNVKFAITRSGPDDDGLYGYAIRMGIDNVSDNTIEAHVYMNVCDAAGKVVEGGDILEVVPCDQIGSVNLDVYGIKKNKSKDAKLKIELHLFHEIATHRCESEFSIT